MSFLFQFRKNFVQRFSHFCTRFCKFCSAFLYFHTLLPTFCSKFLHFYTFLPTARVDPAPSVSKSVAPETDSFMAICFKMKTNRLIEWTFRPRCPVNSKFRVPSLGCPVPNHKSQLPNPESQVSDVRSIPSPVSQVLSVPDVRSQVSVVRVRVPSVRVP